ncbi:hypothetical protein LCGC14_3156860, partial [marine sediment metagenome]
MASRRTLRREATLARILAERRAVTSPTFGTTAQRTQAAAEQVASGTRPPPTSAAGGGFSTAPVAFSQTEAGLRFADETQRRLLTIQSQNAEALARQQHADDIFLQGEEQKFVAAQLQKRLDDEAIVREDERKRVRIANINQLKIERQGTFSALIKSGDQVRAVIFGLGLGPDNDTFDVRARALGTTVQELRGARGLKGTTQEAINRILGRRVG